MAGYEPLNTLKSVDEDLWIVDGPEIRFYGLPFTTRMTLVRLGSGDIFVHSPIQPTPELIDAVSALGPVRHLISPNWIHYAFVGDWAARFPEAHAWASPNVRERAANNHVDVAFDADLAATPDAAWAEDIDQTIVGGSALHQEAVFFHKRSRTLILTDLIENFERSKLRWWMRPIAALVGVLAPKGKAPIDMRLSFRDKPALQASVAQMLDWAPERIILAHGKWIEENGTEELRRAFAWAL